MFIENKEQAFREGRAVKTAAETIMRREGAEGEPTHDIYDMGLFIIETHQEVSQSGGELLIDCLNIWADIEETIGEDDARHLESAHNEMTRAHKAEITEFLKGRRKIEDVLDILGKVLEEDEVGKRVVEEHSDLKQLLTEYQRVSLELLKVAT